jgi:hypothetical protein
MRKGAGPCFPSANQAMDDELAEKWTIEACTVNERVADKVSPVSRINGVPNRSVTMPISIDPSPRLRGFGMRKCRL